MKKVYIGCSIHHAPKGFHTDIERLKKVLEKDFEILNFVGLADYPVKTIYEYDLNCAVSCDIFVADVSYPSLGLGYEIGVCVEAGKPVIGIAKKGQSISRFIQGISKPNYEFIEYEDILDTLPQIVQYK